MAASTYLIISAACSRDKEEEAITDGNVYLLIISKMSRLSVCVCVCDSVVLDSVECNATVKQH